MCPPHWYRLFSAVVLSLALVACAGPAPTNNPGSASPAAPSSPPNAATAPSESGAPAAAVEPSRPPKVVTGPPDGSYNQALKRFQDVYTLHMVAVTEQQQGTATRQVLEGNVDKTIPGRARMAFTVSGSRQPAADGEWIILEKENGTVAYHKLNGTWQQADPLDAPSSYINFTIFTDQRLGEAREQLVGSEVIDGQESNHYRIINPATKATVDIWVSTSTGYIIRSVDVPTADAQTSYPTVILDYSAFDQPVTIEEPRVGAANPTIDGGSAAGGGSATAVASSTADASAATPGSTPSITQATTTLPPPSATHTPAAPQAIPPYTRLLQWQPGQLMRGEDVRAVQQRLLDLGYHEVGTANGVFGPQTKAAVEQFQTVERLTTDGIVGPQTWARLFDPAAQPFPGMLSGNMPVNNSILFLDGDGITLKKMHPAPGSEVETVLRIEKAPSEVVHSLRVNPTSTYIMYSLGKPQSTGPLRYFVVSEAFVAPVEVGSFISMPRWSADGTQLLGATFDPATQQMPIVIVTVATQQQKQLPINGIPDWFPDGSRIVYVDQGNVWSYELATQRSAKLTNVAAEGADRWDIQTAQVLPNGQRIIFYGGPASRSGLTSNGMQWWALPIDGGTPQPLTAPYGNSASNAEFSPRGDVMAFSENQQQGACISQQDLVFRETAVQGRTIPSPTFGNLPPDTSTYVLGLDWADSGLVTFALQPYTCTPEQTQVLQMPMIYVWELPVAAMRGDQAPIALASGSFPAWIDP